MKVIVAENYEKMSRIAGDIFAKVMKEKPSCVLGLATGETPIGLYDCLSEDNRLGKIDFSRVSTVNLDEYYPIKPDNSQSYRYFMNKNLFERVNIDIKNTYVPDGMAEDVEKSCHDYDKRIASLGGIDIQVLGIGRNGHIGFNEPADGLHLNTHITDLTENTIQANSRFFDDSESVPTRAITMGIRSIFSAKKIVILASGKEKTEAISRMASGFITTECPASLLLLHGDITLICDREAGSSFGKDGEFEI